MRSNLFIVRLLVDFAESILGKRISEDEPRADMYLPIWLLALALVFWLAAVAFTVFAIVGLSIGAGVIGLLLALVGTAAFMCWKNQTFVMVNDEEFVYTTFLGNKKAYRFDKIQGIKKNPDSYTLILEDGKIHIESKAVFTGRLAERIEKCFKQ